MIVSLINHKGGVGKTTSTASIGAGLVRMGKKVLLVDIDPQANLTINFSLSPEDGENIYEAITGKYALPIINHSSGVDIVKSTLDLSAAEIEVQNEPGREYLLKDLLNPIKKKYDYILIDCPPSLGILTINALSASDSIIIPIEPGRFSIAGMSKLLLIVDKVKNRLNKNLKTFRILITRYDGRKVIHRETSDMIRNHFKESVFETVIRSNVTIEESQMQGIDIFTLNPEANSSKDYASLCNEIIK